MQIVLTSLVLSVTFLVVVTDGQYYYGDEAVMSGYPLPVPYPSYQDEPSSMPGPGGRAVAMYPTYMDDIAPPLEAYEPNDYVNEYNVHVKPIELHISPYRRQARGKKGGGGGSPGGGWWYYRDHKGCHSGTYGPPPPPGLEKEHYIQGGCGKLGNHFKRVQGKKPGHHGPPKGWKPQGWGPGHGGPKLGYGKKHYGQGWGWGAGSAGGGGIFG